MANFHGHPDEARARIETPSPELVAEKGVALLGYFQDMGENARDVLLLQAERLAIGAHELGDFDDNRDFEAEALQEALDLGNYLARLVIQQKAEIARLTTRG
jgi:hypothetical protein